MNPMEYAGSAERALISKASMKHIPVNGSFELTPVCNMNCDMCYVRLSREEADTLGGLRTLDEWMSLIPQLQKAGVLYLLLTGGEPLTYPGFKELYLACRKAGMIVTVNTNATLIDEAWADFFAQYKPRRINITLYGASDETYQRLCHHPQGFTRTYNAVRLLKERGIDVKIACSLTKLNLCDYEKVLEIGKELDCPVRMDCYMYPAVRERNKPYNEQVRMDPVTAARTRIKVLRAEMGEETFRDFVRYHLHRVDDIVDGTYEGIPMHCLAASCSFTINWRGYMRPCVVMDEPSVNVFEEGFENAWKSIVEGCSQFRSHPGCGICRYRAFCDNCVTAAKAETGAYDGLPEYICTYTKESVRLLREAEEQFAGE